MDIVLGNLLGAFLLAQLLGQMGPDIPATLSYALIL